MMVERYLASNSTVKQGLVEGNGHIVLRDPELLRAVQYGEDLFYTEKSSELDLTDGLIFPAKIPYKKEENVELAYAVTDTKADAVDNFLDLHPEIDKPVDVNDSIWFLGDKNWNFVTAVNKTDPFKDGDDVERLSAELFAKRGFYFYSTGCWIEVVPVTRERKVQTGKLKLGKVAKKPYGEIVEILSKHLQRTGAFDLKFVLTEGLVEIPDYFEGMIQRSDSSMEMWRAKPRRIGYRDLHRAAHGMDILPEAA